MKITCPLCNGRGKVNGFLCVGCLGTGLVEVPEQPRCGTSDRSEGYYEIG